MMRCKGAWITDIKALHEQCRRKGWKQKDLDMIFADWPTDKDKNPIHPHALVGLLLRAAGEGAVDEKAAESLRKRATKIDKVCRVECNCDLTKLIQKHPYDGALIEEECPKCGNQFTFRNMEAVST